VLSRHIVRGAILALVAVFAFPGVSSATTHPKIGPHQAFGATVNGSVGRPQPAVIKVFCPGPVTKGQAGHPLPGQTVEVGPASSASTNTGFTGSHATSISVFFGAPPPSAGGPGRVTFYRYGVPKKIPTSMTFPCGGSGVVTFVPLPESPPTSRSVGVPVMYDNVATALG
jgi:hypothetical protein